MSKTCPKCESSTYRINSYYPAESFSVCVNCNHEVDLCICKPLEPQEETTDA